MEGLQAIALTFCKLFSVLRGIFRFKNFNLKKKCKSFFPKVDSNSQNCQSLNQSPRRYPLDYLWLLEMRVQIMHLKLGTVFGQCIVYGKCLKGRYTSV